MSEFEEYIKNKYPEDYAVLSTMYSNLAMEELYPDQFEVWQHQQAIIDDLRSQLNNMERCYIEKKKECEEFQKKADEVLKYLDGESANRWGLWKEKADMLDQGASNAFEEAYWMAKKVLRGES